MNKLKLFGFLFLLAFVALILVRRSKDASSLEGAYLLDDRYTYTNAQEITSGPSIDRHPSIAVHPSGTIYLTWSSDNSGSVNLWMALSQDGINWSNAWQVTNTGEINTHPSLFIDDQGTFHLVWQKNDLNADNRLNIWYAYSLDGITWQPASQVTDSSINDQHPSIVLDDNQRVVLAWSSLRSGQSDIYLSRLDPAGWTPASQITNDANQDTDPYLFKRPGSEYGLIWARHVNNTQTFQGLFAISDDGITWSTPTPLYDQPSIVNPFPAIFECETGYCGIWGSSLEDISGDIYFANLSNPENAHRSTAFVGQNDEYPRIIKTNQPNIWFMVWSAKTNLYSRFIELKN